MTDRSPFSYAPAPESRDIARLRTTLCADEIAEEGMKTADAFRGRSEINKQLLEGAAFRKAAMWSCRS